VGQEEPTRTVSGSQYAAGTVPYMAPEQLRGEPADARSDIFAAGIVLYEMAAGRRPFQGRVTTEITDAILHAAPPPPSRLRPELPQRLEDTILKCLEKDPDNRYQSAQELGVDLRRLAAPSTPEPLSPIEKPRGRRRRVQIAIASVAFLAMLILIFGIGRRRWFRAVSPEPAAPTAIRSLVVLPFENLSGDPQNAYFSDGIGEEILGHLVKIPGLRVASIRRSGAPMQDVRQVGKDAGVGAVLEGSVRRQGNRVRVTARLTNTETGAVMWASEPYDRELSDIFEVQSAIALQIATALNAALTPEVRQFVERTPTANVEAYDAYLRGMDLGARSDAERDMRGAVASFERAVELDPRFALAQAQLARAHARLYWYHFDHTVARVALAKAALDRAGALQPDLPEVHSAQAYYYYWCKLDYESALREFAVARKGRPSDAVVVDGIAAVFRRQGRIEQALASLAEAVRLDPRNAVLLLQVGESSALARQPANAIRALDRAIALSPEFPRAYAMKVRFLLRLAADTATARNVLSSAASLTLGEDHEVVVAGVLCDVFDRDYQGALNRLAVESHDAFDNQFWFLPKALLEAQVYGLLHRGEAERKHYQAAATLIESQMRTSADDARFHSALGLAYAGLGRKADAVREGKLAVALLPVGKEAYAGAYRIEDLARIYAAVGDRDAAVEQLEYLMSIPFDLAAPGLRLDPAWDSLRDHLRFQRLVAR